MTCPIENCPLPATGLGLCHGHMKHVPRPIQSEIHQLVRRHRGGPAHQKAIRRACIYVNEVLAKWARERVQIAQQEPASLPYKN